MQTKLDLIIRGGRVVDGTGAPERRADVGVAGERIAAIGDLSAAGAPRVVDAAGCIVAPGFIDAHAHSDAYLLLEPDAPSKLAQGVTTEVNGQCGGSAVPRLGAARLSSDWASQTYPSHTSGGVRIGEDPSGPSNPSQGLSHTSRGVRISEQPGPTWTTVASYRELFDAVRPAINAVQFIGHNTLRAGVMGYEPRVAAPDELCEMQRRLEQALDEGGWGLSSGLLYQPGKYAAAEEIAALARTAASKGGIYATHMRSEGDQLLESLGDVLRLARETGIQAQVSHLKTSGRANWHKVEEALALLNTARAEGVRVQADRYPYTAAGTDLDVVLPDWASAGGRDSILDNLRDPETRKRIADELNGGDRDWAEVMIGGGWSDAVRACSGRTVAEAATALRLTPGETVCRFIDLDDTRTGAFFFGMCEANLRRIYAEPWVMPGSDASVRAPWGPLGKDHPHPRAYGTMPRFLRLMTGRVEGFAKLCGLEEAVRRMTSLPATTFGIRDRGVLKAGAYADIAVFDESAFCDVSTYAQPHQFATGLRQVLVNGAVSFDNGRFTGERRGRFLER